MAPARRFASGAFKAKQSRPAPVCDANAILLPDGTSVARQLAACAGSAVFPRVEGAEPLASLRRGRTECGPKEYAG